MQPHPSNASRTFKSGLPLYADNVPLNASAMGQAVFFWFDAQQQTVWLNVDPTGHEVVAPLADGLVNAHDLHNTSFRDMVFEHAAWLAPSSPAGYVPTQAGNLASGRVPGAWSCTNCSGVWLHNVTVQHVGGSGVTFQQISQNNSMARGVVRDVSGNGVQVGGVDNPQTTDVALMTRNNTVSDTLVTDAANEFYGCIGIFAGYNHGLRLVHNNITNVAYGGISLGWGWASMNSTYAGDNEIGYNYIASWMGQLQDTGAIYTLGPQPGSTMHHNFLQHQLLTGIEPPAPCEAQGSRCSLAQVLALEAAPCPTMSNGMCNHTGASAQNVPHGGGLYTVSWPMKKKKKKGKKEGRKKRKKKKEEERRKKKSRRG